MKLSAFTLIELMVVIAIIGILGVSFAPVIGDAVMKARVAKTIEIINTLETAAEMYHNDTGSYATEYGEPDYAAETYHTLTYNPTGLTTWNGPYLKYPLTAAQNPWGSRDTGWIEMWAELMYWPTNNQGFDLNGDGIFEKTGNGNMVLVSGVPEKYAQMLNDKYDTGVAGDWKVTGRVRYDGYHLVVYLCGGG